MLRFRYGSAIYDLIAHPETQKIFVTRAKIVSSCGRQLEQSGFVGSGKLHDCRDYGGARGALSDASKHAELDLYMRIAPECISSGDSRRPAR